MPLAGAVRRPPQGPNVTPGYWRQDGDRSGVRRGGFFRLGDALRSSIRRARKGFRVRRPARGGLQAVDRHLGARRRVAPHRHSQFAPLLRDVVIAGHDRTEVTALLGPTSRRAGGSAGCHRHRSGICSARHRCATSSRSVWTTSPKATGSSNRVVRALLLGETLSIDAHEVTDKGSINQGACSPAAPTWLRNSTRPYSPRVLVAKAPLSAPARFHHRLHIAKARISDGHRSPARQWDHCLSGRAADAFVGPDLCDASRPAGLP